MITNASPMHINGQGECILRGKKEKIFKIYFSSNRANKKKLLSSLPLAMQYGKSKPKGDASAQIFP